MGKSHNQFLEYILLNMEDDICKRIKNFCRNNIENIIYNDPRYNHLSKVQYFGLNDFGIQVLMNKIFIYFSHRGENYNVGFLKEGNAKYIAKVIKNITSADIFEIIPSKDYSEDYMKCINETKEELQLDARPKIKDNSIDLSKNDVIYLCYSNWQGTFPRIIATFLNRMIFQIKLFIQCVPMKVVVWEEVKLN